VEELREFRLAAAGGGLDPGANGAYDRRSFGGPHRWPRANRPVPRGRRPLPASDAIVLDHDLTKAAAPDASRRSTTPGQTRPYTWPFRTAIPSRDDHRGPRGGSVDRVLGA
jgi:hypothetical protein